MPEILGLGMTASAPTTKTHWWPWCRSCSPIRPWSCRSGKWTWSWPRRGWCPPGGRSWNLNFRLQPESHTCPRWAAGPDGWVV